MKKISNVIVLVLAALVMSCPQIDPEPTVNPWLDTADMSGFDISSGMGASGATTYPSTDSELQNFLTTLMQTEGAESGVISQVRDIILDQPASAAAGSRAVHQDFGSLVEAINGYYQQIKDTGRLNATETMVPQNLGNGLDLLALSVSAEMSSQGNLMRYSLPPGVEFPVDVSWDLGGDLDETINENFLYGLLSPTLKAKGQLAFTYSPDTPEIVKKMGVKVAAGVDASILAHAVSSFYGYVFKSSEEINANIMVPSQLNCDFRFDLELVFLAEHNGEGGLIHIIAQAADELSTDFMDVSPEAFQPNTMHFTVSVVRDDGSVAHFKAFDSLESLVEFMAPEV
jgi:hypothetical protein